MTTKKTFASLLIIPAMLVSLSATATEFDQPGDGPFFGETANGQWLIGGKYASMMNTDDGLDSSTNAGLILGYEFARPVWKGKAAFEFQYLPSTSDGTVQDMYASNPSIYPAGGTWENPVYSGYVAYRTPGSVLYGKAKVGIVASRFKITTVHGPQEEVDVTVEVPVLDPDTGEPILEAGEPKTETVVVGTELVGPTPGTEKVVQENKTQIGYGLGLGVHLGKHFDLELEYEGNQGKSQLYNFGINAIGKF